MTTGQVLQTQRRLMDVTQEQLAAVMGVQPGTISRWENARRLRDDRANRYREALATFGTIPTVNVTTGTEAA